MGVFEGVTYEVRRQSRTEDPEFGPRITRTFNQLWVMVATGCWFLVLEAESNV